MPRKLPRLRTDAAAEAFLDQDLSNLDFSQFRPARFEFGEVDGAAQHAPADLRAPTR